MKKSSQQQYKSIKKKSFFTLFLYFLISGFFLTAMGLMVAVFYTSKDIPSIENIKNYSANFTTRMYSRDGVLLNNYASENRIFVPLDEVPPIVKNAFISAEDANFYNHFGIDVIGILKAAYKNAIFFVTGKGQLVGASTITQQVVKNILLSNERTISRKVKEVILSIELSKMLTKNEVLEIYLNHIYLGASAYGVMAASMEYFGKPIKELTVPEAALLAALPKAPSEINPRRNPERAMERRNWVLQRMLENGYITQNDYTVYVEAPIVVTQYKQSTKVLGGVSAFTDYVKTQISSMYGSDAFFSKGFYVRTTMDYKLQEMLYKAFRERIVNYDRYMGYRGPVGTINAWKNACVNLNNFVAKKEIVDNSLKYAVVMKYTAEGLIVLDENCQEKVMNSASFVWAKRQPQDFQRGQVIVFEETENGTMLSQMPEANGGAIIINPKNGDVLAMVGDFHDRPNAFNRAVSAKRQLGSAIKPFVYITALENGFSPNSILVDEELKLSDEWQPRNASRDFLGSVTLRTALERSRNVPTVRIAEMLGTAKLIQRFEEFGLNAEPIQNDLTTALGSFSVTVERVAKAFSVFVNEGRKPETNYIIKISDLEGKQVFGKDGECGRECFNEAKAPTSKAVLSYGTKIAEEDVSFQILSILEGATQRGTAQSLKNISPFGIAGKTGSTSDHKDAWFAGITNDLVLVVYVGKDNATTLGENQYGAVLALPIAKKVLEQTKELYPLTQFTPPKSLTPIVIDYKTGNLPTEASERKIIEYFKKTDKRPRAVEGGKRFDDAQEDISNGIY